MRPLHPGEADRTHPPATVARATSCGGTHKTCGAKRDSTRRFMTRASRAARSSDVERMREAASSTSAGDATCGGAEKEEVAAGVWGGSQGRESGVSRSPWPGAMVTLAEGEREWEDEDEGMGP